MSKHDVSSPTGTRSTARRAVGPVLLAAAVCLIAVGAAGGEQWIVLQKAVKICLECIGIG
ncbi:MAG: CD1871A family CXXC motif-containing protein [Anaerovoracaceae bacterium]